jgi:ectoine hydroxylase-related dioxygenase (phytanoyl-CoA dioxygenase family)
VKVDWESQLRVRQFRDVGFLLVKGCLSPEQIATAQRAAQDLMTDAIDPVRRDSQGRVVRVSRLYDRGGPVAQLFGSPAVLDALEGLLGPNIELVLNRHNHLTRSDESGKARRIHRDVLQWSRPIVTAIFYLDDAYGEKATHVIPGSQFLPFVGTPNNGGTWLDEHHIYAPVADQLIPVPADSGDVLLMDGLLFHAMGYARGEDSQRYVATAAYRSVDELISTHKDSDHVLLRGERLWRGDS